MPTYLASCNPDDCHENATTYCPCGPHEMCLGYAMTNETGPANVTCCIWLCSTMSDYIIATFSALLFPLLIVIGISLCCFGVCRIHQARRQRPIQNRSVTANPALCSISGVLVMDENQDRPPTYMECVSDHNGQPSTPRRNKKRRSSK
ncbi:unnamed protein product [Cyprideis torosa]|uniref:Uncharacterized protein n=1 Tax=Cyprideis torosa TaxID=163714 RepID=A0A7R8W801_9CRUS|nr:unnamed protein product [Cyprideis torosa]CAG0888092.1 unnamed protein product [Cyprideis torosa]